MSPTPTPNEIQIVADCGLHDDRIAFTIDERGKVLSISVTNEFWDEPGDGGDLSGYMPLQFDTQEYQQVYGELPQTIELQDIRYQVMTESGTVWVLPTQAYRNLQLERRGLVLYRVMTGDDCNHHPDGSPVPYQVDPLAAVVAGPGGFYTVIPGANSFVGRLQPLVDELNRLHHKANHLSKLVSRAHGRGSDSRDLLTVYFLLNAVDKSDDLDSRGDDNILICLCVDEFPYANFLAEVNIEMPDSVSEAEGARPLLLLKLDPDSEVAGFLSKAVLPKSESLTNG